MRHIVVAGTVLAICAMTLPGCGRAKHRAQVAEPAPMKQGASPEAQHRQALVAWEAWLAMPGCSGPERDAFIAAIGQLKGESAHWQAGAPDTVDAHIARERHVMAAFGFADESFDRGCFKDAERMYRHIAEFYPGSAHTFIRERAQAGANQAQAVAGVKPD